MSLVKSGGRQARDYDKLLNEAFESGLSLDKSDVTPHLVYRNLAPKSKVLYQSLLEPWKAYKNKYPEATPQEMATLKHFTKFITLAMRGRVKKDNPQGRPTVDSVRNQMRKFCSAWNRDNVDKGQRIPEEVSLSMAPYIEGELADQIGLLRGKQAKFHWEEDWHDYIHEGSRVDNTNMVNMHCYTSARLSEVCQAKYRPTGS
ncbi:carbonic anhydrase 2, partial [Metarhizium majus ARSEF 297]